MRNVLERAAIFSDGATIGVSQLHLETPSEAGESGAPETLQDLERRAIEQALPRSDGSRKEAAANLGIGLRTLYDKLKRYGIT